MHFTVSYAFPFAIFPIFRTSYVKEWTYFPFYPAFDKFQYNQCYTILFYSLSELLRILVLKLGQFMLIMRIDDLEISLFLLSYILNLLCPITHDICLYLFSRCDHIFSFYPSFQTFLPKLWDYYYDSYCSISSHAFPSKIGQPSKLYIWMCGPLCYTYPSYDEYTIWCTLQYLMPIPLIFSQSSTHHV